VSGEDEDLLAFTGMLSGTTTEGTWGLYFDGTAVGLGESGNEDVDALFISESEDPVVQPTLYLSTKIGTFSVPGLSGAKEDVFAFHPTPGQLEPFTGGTFGPGLTLDGSAYGLANFDIDGIYLGVAPNEGPGGSPGGGAALGGTSQAGVTTVTASGNTSLDALPSGGSGFRERNSSPAKHDMLPTNAGSLASVIAALAPPAESERSQGAGPRATGGGAHPLPRPSADRLSALDYLFAPRGPQRDSPSAPRSGRASGSMDAGGGPADVLSEEALWAWFTSTKKRAL
jgi:hypothetical protein